VRNHSERVRRAVNEVLAANAFAGYPLEGLMAGSTEGPMQLRLSTRTVDDVLIVDCAGRILFGDESISLRETVKGLIPQNGRIILNLAQVNYIDSGGLGTLVALYTTARNAGGTIKLASLTERVGDLLQVTKLLTVFEVYDSEKEALASFRTAA